MLSRSLLKTVLPICTCKLFILRTLIYTVLIVMCSCISEIYNIVITCRKGLGLWCLMPLSTIFQLYRGVMRGQSLSWSYGSWIYSYLCNQRISPLTLCVRSPLRRGVLDATLCDKVCQWPVGGFLWVFRPRNMLTYNLC
jgi:hypothetical protein